MEAAPASTPNPPYVRGLNEGRPVGRAEGKAEGLLAILTRRGLEVTGEE
ncbi:MAG: hypothetical protein HY906_16100, partial [Deltaproteobacteria bacterium]|nr:hypothetical protein [Deltaproteobacteria bacterium]